MTCSRNFSVAFACQTLKKAKLLSIFLASMFSTRMKYETGSSLILNVLFAEKTPSNALIPSFFLTTYKLRIDIKYFLPCFHHFLLFISSVPTRASINRITVTVSRPCLSIINILHLQSPSANSFPRLFLQNFAQIQ